MVELTPQQEAHEPRWTERLKRVVVDTASDIKQAVSDGLDRAGLLSNEQMEARSRERAAQMQYRPGSPEYTKAIAEVEKYSQGAEWNHALFESRRTLALAEGLDPESALKLASFHSRNEIDTAKENAAKLNEQIAVMPYEHGRKATKDIAYENDPDPNLRGADRSKRFHNENLTRMAEGAYRVGKEGIIQHLNGELLDLKETTRRDITKADIKELALDACQMMANIKSNQWLAHQSLPIDIPRNIAAGPFEDDVKLGMRRGIFEWSHQQNQELKHAQENSKGQVREMQWTDLHPPGAEHNKQEKAQAFAQKTGCAVEVA